MNPSIKLLLEEFRRLFAEQTAQLDRRFADLAASIAPFAAASVATAPAPSAAASVTTTPAPSTAACITPRAPSRADGCEPKAALAPPARASASTDPTTALTSAPSAPPASPAAATRTPRAISLELAAPPHFTNADPQEWIHFPRVLSAGPDDNERSVDSSLPSAPAPLLDSSASDPRYFVLDAATGSALRLPDSDPKEPIQHQALVGVLPFPGGATRVRDDRLLAAPEALAEQVIEDHFAKGLTFMTDGDELALHDFLCDAHDLAPPRQATATHFHLARPDAVPEALRRFITNPGVSFVGPGSAHDGHIPEEHYVTAAPSLSSIAGGNAHPASRKASRSANAAVLEEEVHRMLISSSASSLLQLVLPEEEDEVPSTLPNRCLMNCLILIQSCFSPPFRCSWDAVLYRQHRPWHPPTELRLVTCDAGLRPLPWPSFDMVERGTLGALLVYDITRRQSFDHIFRWLDELRAPADKNIVLLLVGNKSDLEEQRAMSTEDAKEFAEKENRFFLEASALLETNVASAFPLS